MDAVHVYSGAVWGYFQGKQYPRLWYGCLYGDCKMCILAFSVNGSHQSSSVLRSIVLAIAFLSAAMVTLLPSARVGQAALPGVCQPTQVPPVLNHGASGTWNAIQTDRNTILFNGSAYNMWFTGGNGSDFGIGYSSSRDGVNWHTLGYPVLPAASPWPGAIGGPFEPSVIWNGTSYLMYYTSYSSSTEKDIGLAVSKDMIHWNEFGGNPIIRPGPSAYDSEWTAYPSVIYDHSFYKMWYAGQDKLTKTETINYATSLDGVHWTKHADNPVLTSQTVNSVSYDEVRYPSVVTANWGYLMAFYAYTPSQGDILYATSNNGLNWTVGASPLLRTGGNTSGWDYYVSSHALLYNGSNVLLYYTGQSNTSPYHTSIGLALCYFISASNTQTLTSTLTSTRITTVTAVSTLTLTLASTVTSPAPVAAYDSLLEALSVVLGVSLGGSLWFLIRRNGRTIQR